VSTAEGSEGHQVPLVAGYRPWLDGLRALAVLMVVAQHMIGAMPIDLGFVGVGVFFGLSGYLITSLLLDERAARGRVSLSTFYLRRAARLFPALVLMLVVCNVLFLLQRDLAPLKGSLAAITYTANYVQILHADRMVAYGPTWSLAVEEHFYILWPLVLLGVSGRYGLRTALRFTLVVSLASLIWRGVLALLDAGYLLIGIGSLERADSLLYGCAAAIALRIGWRPKPWMLWVGLAVIGVSPLLFNHESYPILVVGSAVVALATAALVAGLDYAAPPWLQRSMSLRPIVFIGVLSYGIYLWHGPLMRIVQNFGEHSFSYRAIAAVTAVVVAAISHRYLEVPVRSWARRRTRRAGSSASRSNPDVAPPKPRVAEADS
jgi:peptidoglycan/LPS O-acetylase OafA/YrhL